MEYSDLAPDRLNEVFSFYNDGVKDAMRLMLLDYHHTEEPIVDYPGYEYHYIFNDLDDWLSNAEDSNSIFNTSTEDVYQIIKLACEELDIFLYKSMKVFFNDLEFKVKQAQDITSLYPNRFEFLITLEFI